tara:strand:+ start:538 stop:1107 length:570 start_codon:yes stop_codon:yes gene_type:complete
MEAREFFKIPDGILTSIGNVEAGRVMTGGKIVIWPWTVNHNGKSLFFNNKQQYLTFLSNHRIKENIDIGCMQISWKWHSNQFVSIFEMGEPQKNVHYAARYLRKLYGETQSWIKAVKFYHSRKKSKNEKYFQRFSFYFSLTPTKIRTLEMPKPFVWYSISRRKTNRLSQIDYRRHQETEIMRFRNKLIS